MKTQFWTRKGYIGLLMALVLALGVQGVAEALTLTKTSGDLQTKPAGSSFEITFSVRLDSNTTRIYDSTTGQQTDEYGNTIDSSGYLIHYVGGKARRLISSTDLSDANVETNDIPSNPLDSPYTLTTLADNPNLKVRVSGDRSNISSYGDRLDQTANDPIGYLYLNGTSVVDSQDRAVYVEEPATPQTEPQTYKYTRAKEDPVAPYTSNASQRYAYNDEQIRISQGTGQNIAAYRIDRGLRYRLWAIDASDRNAILKERDKNVGIPSRITLRIETDPETAGTHTVTIADTRLSARQPVDGVSFGDYPNPQPVVAPITFTLYTTTGTGDHDAGDATITVAPSDRSQSTSLTTRQIGGKIGDTERDIGLYNVEEGTTALLVYQVISGPGTLYFGKYDEPSGTPTTSLAASQNANVYLYLNGGDSKVRVYVDGADPDDDGATITFSYTGTDRVTSSGNNPASTRDTTPTVSVSPSSLQGAPNSIHEITVTPSSASIASSPTFRTEGGSVSPSSGSVRTVRLPESPATYRLTADATSYNPRTISVTVTGTADDDTEEEEEEDTATLGTLTVTKFGNQVGAQQQIRVSASSAPSSDVNFTVDLNGVRATSGTLATNGRGSAIVPGVPTTGIYALTIRASGYTTRTITFAASGQTPPTTTDTTTTTTTTTDTTTPTVGDPDSISIGGSATRTGIANTQLDAPLLVRVLDDDGDAVAETRVIFRVRTGQGRLSDRGNGRAVAVQTDTNGYARAPYTPISASSTVEAEASGVTRRVTFTITASGGAATPTTRDTDTGSDTISPVVHTAAAKRPPMLWVDNGAIYALVDKDVQRFAPTVDNALSLAIGGDTVYWTEKTGDSAGTINSAHLDGTGVKELKAIMAVPMGITVDTTANLLYWTNSRGRIQSLNADGSGRVENVLQNLTSPLDIGLAGGNVYWTHSNGGIGFASLKGQKQIRNISNGADAAGSLVIGGGKVYWTEETGENGGRIKSANLNGSGITDVASIFAVPIGIGLDSSRGKLFWTNSRGRIQSSDLEGNGVSNVVDGLGSPGDMVLSNSIAAPSETSTSTTETSKSQYDVNGDGSVDNMDAGLVSEAMGTSNAKYDVNGDGTVNFLDLLLVFDNRDEGAASAPTVLGMQLSTVQVDVLQEQIDLLIATGDRSPAAMRTLIYLQQLIATARPEQTQLLANYPNPFNPETWIPYELATDTNVTLTIYNAQGVVVRSLILGHQSSGYYVGRDRAAYWDGRNAYGEQVASGIYFYQLETDAMSLMRKMVILK